MINTLIFIIIFANMFLQLAQPYPSWDWHQDAAAGQPENNNCSGLVSVFRTRADRCNRLWVLDSGVVDSLVNFRVACPPKILIFDLTTDTLVTTPSSNYLFYSLVPYSLTGLSTN